MRTILVLVRKDFLNFFRNKAAVSLTFIVPFAMIWLFGYIFGVNKKDSGPVGIPLAVVNASDNPAAAKMVEALQAEKSFRIYTKFVNADKTTRPLTEADLRPMLHDGGTDFHFALVIPADLVSASGFGLHLKILSNPRNESETQMVNGLLQKTIFTSIPQLLGQSLQASAKNVLGDVRFKQFNGTIAGAVSGAFGGDRDQIQRSIEAGDFGMGGAATNASVTSSASGAPSADVFSRLIRIETEQVVGAEVKNPEATRIVGGWAMQFLLFAVSASAASLFYERDAGIFQRILAAPVTRSQILWGKFLYGVSIGLFQLLVLFFAGRVLFGIEVEQHLGLLVLVCIFAAAACTSFGMLLAALAPNAEAANGMATFIIMLMSALGGAWFPLWLMPAFIRPFTKLTLVYWSMEGFSAVLWAGNTFVQLLPILGILGGITAVVMSIAVWRFNRGKIFE
jgi:ABC-2 type transport system permease protein